jgi:hypothetical protein
MPARARRMSRQPSLLPDEPTVALAVDGGVTPGVPVRPLTAPVSLVVVLVVVFWVEVVSETEPVSLVVVVVFCEEVVSDTEPVSLVVVVVFCEEVVSETEPVSLVVVVVFCELDDDVELDVDVVCAMFEQMWLRLRLPSLAIESLADNRVSAPVITSYWTTELPLWKPAAVFVPAASNVAVRVAGRSVAPVPVWMKCHRTWPEARSAAAQSAALPWNDASFHEIGGV